MEELDLKEWLLKYNQGEHQGKMCNGRTPMKTLLDSKKIWEERVTQLNLNWQTILKGKKTGIVRSSTNFYILEMVKFQSIEVSHAMQTPSIIFQIICKRAHKFLIII